MMWKRRRHHGRLCRQQSDSHSDFNELDELSMNPLDVTETPDLTRRIMGRLGYMRVAPRVAMRYRVQRWGGRVGLLLTTALAIGIGWHVYEGSDAARRAADMTLPAAIGTDLRQQQHRVVEVIRSFRSFTAPPAQAPVAPVNHAEPDAVETEEGGIVPDPVPSHLPFRWA